MCGISLHERPAATLFGQCRVREIINGGQHVDGLRRKRQAGKPTGARPVGRQADRGRSRLSPAVVVLTPDHRLVLFGCPGQQRRKRPAVGRGTASGTSDRGIQPLRKAVAGYIIGHGHDLLHHIAHVDSAKIDRLRACALLDWPADRPHR